MAKKKGKKKFEFSQIGKIMDGISDKTNVLIEDESSSKGREFIDTGVYILNALMSKSILNGGMLSNRITALAGPTGVGKSFICYNICANAQKMGYHIIYIDTEFSIELEDMRSYGIDTTPEHLKLLRSSKVEDIKKFLTQMLNELKEAKNSGYELDKILFVIDSAGQLASNKEVDDALAGKDKADMTRAKAIKSMFRILNSDLGYLNIPMLVTNHTYMSQGDMFPRAIMSGGCLEAGNEIICDNGIKKIENIVEGDYVKTLNGYERVYETYTFEKERYEVNFQDGSRLVCSDEHRFLNGNDWSESGNWVCVKDLKENDKISTETNDVLSLSKTVQSIKNIGLGKVHDIMVENDHHYITNDGIVHHNTGLAYTASTIVMLTKAKLKTGDEDELDLGQSGIVVTAKSDKNRLAKPKKVKFEINFSTGLNKFKGLEYFCTPENFETVGIAKGKMEVNKETGEEYFKPGGTRYYVRHKGRSYFAKNLFNADIFTQEVLEALNPIIEDYFDYSDADEIDELEKKFIESQEPEYKDADEIDSTDADFFDEED